MHKYADIWVNWRAPPSSEVTGTHPFRKSNIKRPQQRALSGKEVGLYVVSSPCPVAT